LIEVGSNRKVTIVKRLRHTRTSFVVMPGVRCSGRKEVR
jgi:hypothetical protein